MKIIDNDLRGTTDLPVRFIGIQEQGYSYSNAMFASTEMTWLREVDGQEPSKTWLVPTRAGQRVAYRDAIILDHKNEFVDVQNLTNERIDYTDTTPDRKDNYDNFVQLIRDAATIEDSDGDHLPDHWERDHFSDLSATRDTPLGGIPAVVAFATGGEQVPLSISSPPSRPFTFTFRNRIGAAAAPLRYQLQTSTDGGKTWSFNRGDWSPAEAFTTYDGTATRLNRFTYNPSATPGPDTLFRLSIGINE